MAVLALLDDLLFQSKLQAAAAAASRPVRFARQPSAALQQLDAISLVLVDLSLPGSLAAIQALHQQRPDLRIIGYGAHVETALLAAAQAAGCRQVLPRSAFVQQLPTLLRHA